MREARTHHSGVVAWLSHHAHSLVSSLGRAMRRPWATLLTIGVMAVALALPLGLWAVLDNIARFGGELRQSREITVFLKPALALDRAQALARRFVGTNSWRGVLRIASITRAFLMPAPTISSSTILLRASTTDGLARPSA